MNSQSRCNYVWPTGLPLIGTCGALAVEGGTRCALHSSFSQPPSYFYLPGGLLDNEVVSIDFQNPSPGMETSPEPQSPDSDTSVQMAIADALLSLGTLQQQTGVAHNNTPVESIGGSTLVRILSDVDSAYDSGEDLQFSPATASEASQATDDADAEAEAIVMEDLRYDGEGEDCAICGETLFEYPEGSLEKELAIRTPCGHLFGRHCLYIWLTQHSTCPMCRSPVSLNILIPRSRRPHECDHITLPLKSVGTLLEDDSVADNEGYIYGIDTSYGFFDFKNHVYRVPDSGLDGRYVATMLYHADGRRQLRTDDARVRDALPWFPIPDLMRPVDREEMDRVVTNLTDESQIWEIRPGRTHIQLMDSRYRVPRGVQFVVLTTSGKFLRWAYDYEEWLKGA